MNSGIGAISCMTPRSGPGSSELAELAELIEIDTFIHYRKSDYCVYSPPSAIGTVGKRGVSMLFENSACKKC